MKDIDAELIDWAVGKIKEEYPDDVALLIGHVGACKTPGDEQNMAFDFFIPCTERGNRLSQTFIIEDMGYDLYPISWERLQGIAMIREPGMIFPLMKGEVIYARTEEDSKRFYAMKDELRNHLNNKEERFEKALEFLGTAMEIYQTMMFEESLGSVRKAAGGISCFLTQAVALINGQYLTNGYGNLSGEIKRFTVIPGGFRDTFELLLSAATIPEIQDYSRLLIKLTRDFFVGMKSQTQKMRAEDSINYMDLADWYYEARYTFRRIAYFSEHGSAEDCFLLGCYLQIEFDAIADDFNLIGMDLLGSFRSDRLDEFAGKARQLEEQILEKLKAVGVPLRIYDNIDEFLK